MRSIILVVILAFVAPARAAESGEGYLLKWAERPKHSDKDPTLFLRNLVCDRAGKCQLTTTELRCRGGALFVYFELYATSDWLKVEHDGEWMHLEVKQPAVQQIHKLKVKKRSDARPGVQGEDVYITEASGAKVVRNGDKVDTVELEPITIQASGDADAPRLTEIPLPCNRVVVMALSKK